MLTFCFTEFRMCVCVLVQRSESRNALVHCYAYTMKICCSYAPVPPKNIAEHCKCASRRSRENKANRRNVEQTRRTNSQRCAAMYRFVYFFSCSFPGKASNRLVCTVYTTRINVEMCTTWLCVGNSFLLLLDFLFF